MLYKFHNAETGQDEEVREEPWKWVVHYKDHTSLKQFGDDGVFHQFREINQAEVWCFELVSDHGSMKLLIPSGATLIHYYDEHQQVTSQNSTGEILNDSGWKQTTCFGWKITVDGKSVKRIIRIDPNDYLIISDGE